MRNVVRSDDNTISVVLDFCKVNSTGKDLFDKPSCSGVEGC